MPGRYPQLGHIQPCLCYLRELGSVSSLVHLQVFLPCFQKQIIDTDMIRISILERYQTTLGHISIRLLPCQNMCEDPFIRLCNLGWMVSIPSRHLGTHRNCIMWSIPFLEHGPLAFCILFRAHFLSLIPASALFKISLESGIEMMVFIIAFDLLLRIIGAKPVIHHSLHLFVSGAHIIILNELAHPFRICGRICAQPFPSTQMMIALKRLHGFCGHRIPEYSYHLLCKRPVVHGEIVSFDKFQKALRILTHSLPPTLPVRSDGLPNCIHTHPCVSWSYRPIHHFE